MDNESGQEQLGKLTALGLKPDKLGIRGTFSTRISKQSNETSLTKPVVMGFIHIKAHCKLDGMSRKDRPIQSCSFPPGRYLNWLGAVTRSWQRPETFLGSMSDFLELTGWKSMMSLGCITS